MKNFFDKYSLYLILILAAVLRLLHIDKRDFWYDEAFTGIALKEKFPDMMSMIIQDVHPPLYYISAKVFSSLFNYSVFGIRLYSAIFGVLGVWAVYLFAKELFSRRVGVWAALITAISPFAIQYSQEARMYSMLGFLVVIASYFFIKGLKTNKIVYYILWGMFLGLSFLTHYLGIIFSAIFIIVFFAYKFFENKKFNFLFSIDTYKNLFSGYFVSFIIFLPWIKKFYVHMANSQDGLSWIKPATFGDIFTNIRIFVFGSPLGEMTGGLTGMPSPNEFYGTGSLSIFAAIIIFLTAIVVYILKDERKKELASLLIFSFGFLILIYALSFLDKHYLVSRYLLPSAYFLYALIGLWLSKMKLRYIAFSLLIYIVFLSLIIPVKNSTGWNLLQKDAGRFKGKNFYILNSFDYVIAKYYFGADKLVLFNMDWPQYNPEGWAAIGQSMKRTENIDDIRNDRNGLIISNTILRGQIEDRKDIEYRNDLNFDGLEFLEKYENISIYKFGK